jgi:hypothetical protein
VRIEGDPQPPRSGIIERLVPLRSVLRSFRTFFSGTLYEQAYVDLPCNCHARDRHSSVELRTQRARWSPQEFWPKLFVQSRLPSRRSMQHDRRDLSAYPRRLWQRHGLCKSDAPLPSRHALVRRVHRQQRLRERRSMYRLRMCRTVRHGRDLQSGLHLLWDALR